MARSHSFVRYFASLIAAGESQRCGALAGLLRLELSIRDPSLDETLSWIYKNQDLWPEKEVKIRKGIAQLALPLFRDLKQEYKLFTRKSINHFDIIHFRTILEQAMLSGLWTGQIGHG